MEKLKFNGAGLVRFDYKGEEKILEPGETYDLELNSYIEGLKAFGLLTAQEKTEKPKN